MKFDLADLKKAMDYICKTSAVVVSIKTENIGGIERLCLSYQDADNDEVVITIAKSESGGFNNITTKKRF